MIKDYSCVIILSERVINMAKILVTMPDEFLNKVDGLADKESCSRSELIREALRNYMRRISKQQLQNASRNAEILEDILS